ncbi:hypothetical protein [Rhizobium redzepovicii]|uniref:hypothetical protein n=1 Tax=Rhizobium redzepovicii TaxID=2867518 RepID=UPI002872820E|nr:hypothetical protein [Rhizobium redzepovicii]MDR9782275.1 hypothetical protein [Rhizobium redzepovicii]
MFGQSRGENTGEAPLAKPSEIQHQILTKYLKPGMTEDETLKALERFNEELQLEFKKLNITAQDFIAEFQATRLARVGSQAEVDREDIRTEAIRKLKGDSDRSAAITFAAIIESELGSALRKHLTREDEHRKLVDDQFKENGLFGTFGARITAGTLLSVFGQEAAINLKTISKIRNRFAHRIDVDSFDHNDISTLCANLKLIDRHIRKDSEGLKLAVPGYVINTEYGYAENYDLCGSPRSRFFTSCMFLLNALMNVQAGTRSPALF